MFVDLLKELNYQQIVDPFIGACWNKKSGKAFSKPKISVYSDIQGVGFLAEQVWVSFKYFRILIQSDKLLGPTETYPFSEFEDFKKLILEIEEKYFKIKQDV